MDIVEARKSKGWNRAELARQSGVGYQTLSFIERGERPCTEQNGIAIALALDIDPYGLTLPGGRAFGSVHWNCELVPLESAPEPCDSGFMEQVYQAELRGTIRELLRSLSHRQQRILTLRFGLNDGYAHTLEECGKLFGVTRERIRQIEEDALLRLRHPRCARKLRDYR